MHRLVGKTQMAINSQHNEGVETVGGDIAITAMAPDGVIEAIEVKGAPFALGVQWHPEMFSEPGCDDRKIFEGLVAAAAQPALE